MNHDGPRTSLRREMHDLFRWLLIKQTWINRISAKTRSAQSLTKADLWSPNRYDVAIAAWELENQDMSIEEWEKL